MHANEILLYKTLNGDIKIDILYKDEDIWLTQKKIALLFVVQVPAISKHLKNIFESKELEKNSVISILETTGINGQKYSTKIYNLDAIISIGYRVNSKQAVNFRIWATKILKEVVIKGFSIDSDRLKNESKFGQDYFDELLEKIEEIRASERNFYQKITDIYSECSADYNLDSDITKQFYARVHNKLLFSIYGNTAPEIKQLNHIVNMYLDYAELQASKQRLMKMQDWVSKLDAFLLFNELDILENAGKISAEVAKVLAEDEYDKYLIVQDKLHKSDFDELCKVSKISKNSD